VRAGGHVWLRLLSFLSSILIVIYIYHNRGPPGAGRHVQEERHDAQEADVRPRMAVSYPTFHFT
jgi:hypothetical protein